MSFGPVTCLACGARFPVGEGLLDFVGEREPPRGLQGKLEAAWFARSYEKYVRPSLELALTRGFDRDSEYLVYRSLIGRPSGPVLDLGCGTGLFARRLATEQLGQPIIGLDVSKPMIEEAIAQSREASTDVDFIRAEAPQLPFQDASLGAVLQVGSFHLIADLEGTLREVRRCLRPGAPYVGSGFVLPPYTRAAYSAMGFHARSEVELKRACEAAGLQRFERLRTPPMLIFKAERP
ncbi:MAG: class I SAM-dependent methyltransferase [Archangiaceae bacterium]|nr:class I SAM-dependent methyltransferase [Archangiaceae bacterium]